MAKAQRFEVDPSKAASQFHRLPMVVRDIVRLCDGRRTLEAICASSPLTSQDTVDVLHRLTELGVVAVRGRPTARRATPTRELHAWIEGARPAAFAPPPPVAAPPPQTVVTIDLVAPERDFSADEEQFFARTIDHLIED